MTQQNNGWHYVRRGQSHGPVSTEQLRALLQEGSVAPADMVWREPMTDWVAASTVPELAVARSKPGPPPLPPTAQYASAYTPTYAQRDIGQDAGMRMLIPVGRSPLAIIAGYAGLLGFIPLVGIAGIVFGILAVREIGKDPSKHGLGRAWTGIILGSIFTLGQLLVLIPAIMSA